jgi:hypothetical protein
MAAFAGLDVLFDGFETIKPIATLLTRKELHTGGIDPQCDRKSLYEYWRPMAGTPRGKLESTDNFVTL